MIAAQVLQLAFILKVQMDFLFGNEILLMWLTQYGSIVLFLLLIIGVVALPVPEETLMVMAGVLMSKGILGVPFTAVAAYAGSICGISISYMLGRKIGSYFILKYGHWLGITEKRLHSAHAWFERFGKWTLLIGYFIPGVRHFTGFSSGMTKMDFKQFALFAYGGALLWVSTFLSLGYFCSEFCFSFFKKLEAINLDLALIFAAASIVFYIGYKKFRFSSKKVET